MSSKNYYEKYWKADISLYGHVKDIPHWPEKELRMFYDTTRKFIGKDVLDIGAGEGLFLDFLSKQKPDSMQMAALEISEKAVELGKKRLPMVTYVVGSADDVYPFDDSRFDTLFMTDVIEHLVDIDEALNQCHRVLKENGKLIIIAPVFNWLKKVLIAAFFWEKFFYPNNPHIRFFTKKSMDKIMKAHGFKRVYYRWGLSWFGIMPQNAYFVYEKI